MEKRINLKSILDNPIQRRELFTGVIQATQAREGIVTTQEQAESAYDKARKERRKLVECPAWEASMSLSGCEALQESANATALKIINHESVLAVTENKFYKMIACSTCAHFSPVYKTARLDMVIESIHQKCLDTLSDKDESDTRSRYKKWYDKHGKQYKQKQREKQK